MAKLNDKKIIVDSDAIYAIYNLNDPLHDRATKTAQWLNDNHFQLIYPTSVIFEIMSLFQRVLSSPAATMKLKEMISNGLLITHAVDDELLKESASIFQPAGSKKNTLVDCSVVVIAKKIKADGVFAYDGFYTKHSLKFAEDLISLRMS